MRAQCHPESRFLAVGRKFSRAAACLTLLAMTGALGQPRVFRCVDAKGRVTYTQTGCDASADQRRLGERAPTPAAPSADDRAKDAARTGAAATAGGSGTSASAPKSAPAVPAASGGVTPTPIRRGSEADAVQAPAVSPGPAPQGFSAPRDGPSDPTRTELEAPDHRSRRAAPR